MGRRRLRCKKTAKVAIALGGVSNYALGTFSRMQAANIPKCFTAAYTANIHAQQPQLCNIYYYALQKELWSHMPMPEDLSCTGSMYATPLVVVVVVVVVVAIVVVVVVVVGEGKDAKKAKEEPLLEVRGTRV